MNAPTNNAGRPRRRSYLQKCLNSLQERRDAAKTPEERSGIQDDLSAFCGTGWPYDAEEEAREIAFMPVVLCQLLQRHDARALLQSSRAIFDSLHATWRDDTLPVPDAQSQAAAREELQEHLLPQLSSEELDHIEFALYQTYSLARGAFLDLCPPEEGEATI